MEYTICFGRNLIILGIEVNEKIKEGFRPHGSVFAQPETNLTVPVFCQPMIKEDANVALEKILAQLPQGLSEAIRKAIKQRG